MPTFKGIPYCCRNAGRRLALALPVGTFINSEAWRAEGKDPGTIAGVLRCAVLRCCGFDDGMEAWNRSWTLLAKNRDRTLHALTQWELRNVASLRETTTSDLFAVGNFVWQLKCFPRQEVTPQVLGLPSQKGTPQPHVSVFLEHMFPHLTPAGPQVSGTLAVENHNNSSASIKKPFSHTFQGSERDLHFSALLPLSDVTTPYSGFLRADGALVIYVELVTTETRRPAAPCTLSSDLLALLEAPGPTSDITLTAGGRSFPAHRAMLAARCEFFRTLFGSGFDDSTARELPLPDADADALALLLRYLYGGALDYNRARRMLKPAAELADRLRLTDARTQLEQWILAAADQDSIVDFLLWAECRSSTELQAALEAMYICKYAAAVSDANVTALATSNPKLMVKLHQAALKHHKANAKR